MPKPIPEEVKDAVPGEVTERGDAGEKECPETWRGLEGGEMDSRDDGRDEDATLSLWIRRIIELRRSGRGKERLGSARVGIVGAELGESVVTMRMYRRAKRVTYA